MRKKIQRLLAVLLGISVLVFIGIMVRYRRQTVSETIPKENTREIVVLSYYQQKNIRDALELSAKKYMESHKDIKIVLKYVNPSAFQKEICLEKDGNKLSDMIICDNAMTPALVSMGILQNLSEYYTPQKADTMLQTAYQSTLVGGKPYSVPFVCDPYVVFYNRDYYEKNHIKQPESMEGFVDVLKKVRTFGNYNLAFAAKDTDDISSLFLQMIYQYGGTILDLDGENSLDFYNVVEEFRNDNVIPRDIINWNQEDLMKNFEDGMVINVIARLSSMSLIDEEKIKFSYGIMEIPQANNEVYLMHGENIGITGDSNDREVMEFLEYLISEESIRRFCDAANKVSVYVKYENTPGEEKGLGESFFKKFRYYGTVKRSYSTWFIISEGIKSRFTEFLADLSIHAENEAKLMQNEVRDAILERE